MKSRIVSAIVLAGVVALGSAPFTAHARAGGAVGGDKGAQGCSVSSGTSWSVLKNACIRIWEGSVKLLPVTSTGTATLAAFAVFNDDNTKAELFLPQGGPSIILEKNAGKKEVWASGDWMLEGGKIYTLKNKGVAQYSSASK